MIYDFDEDSQSEYNGNEAETEIDQEEEEQTSSFPPEVPPTEKKADDEEPILKEEVCEKSKEEKPGIKIEIDSMEKMMSEIAFATEAFNQAVGRIEGNKDLSQILNLLSQIKIDQFENFKNIEKNINLDNAEKIIEDKILSSVSKVDKKINANIRIIESKTEKATDRYQKYAEAFQDPDVIDQLENIEKIEKSLSSFKFRNIVFSSIITAIITATVTFIAADAGLKSYYETKADNAVQKNMDEKEKIAYLLSKKHIQIFDGKENAQFIFSKKENVEYFTADDGRKVFQFQK